MYVHECTTYAYSHFQSVKFVGSSVRNVIGARNYSGKNNQRVTLYTNTRKPAFLAGFCLIFLHENNNSMVVSSFLFSLLQKNVPEWSSFSFLISLFQLLSRRHPPPPTKHTFLFVFYSRTHLHTTLSGKKLYSVVNRGVFFLVDGR